MVRALRPWTLVAAASLIAIGTVPTAAATTTSTVCYGGESDPSLRIDSTRLVDLEFVTVTVHLSTTYLDMWEESNDKPGLQRTEMVCTERTLDDGGYIIDSRSWVETPADTPLAG